MFETLLVVDGRPVELDAHLARLTASARELFGDGAAARIDGPVRALALARAAEVAAGGAPRAAAGEAPGLGRLRLSLAPTASGRLDLDATAAAIDGALVLPSPDRGPELASIAVAGGLGGHKWADRRLLEGVAETLADALALIVDADGHALEAERANLFAVVDGALATPPADGRILPGVTRRLAIDLARELGIAVTERPLGLADLRAADEVLLTGSLRGVESATALDGSALRTGSEVGVLLAAALRARWLDSRGGA